MSARKGDYIQLCKFLLRSLDNLVLELRIQVIEVVTVARDTDNEILVLLRILLRVNQSLAADDVELQVVTPHLEVGANQRRQVVNTLLAYKKDDLI